MDKKRVLLVEDDKEDVELILENLETSRADIILVIKYNGVEAYEYCTNQLNNSGDLPDLILLDLNMPLMNGHEFMSKIKQNESLKKIPVIVFTTSDAESDINKSYQNGASCYITKPIGFDQYEEIMEAIKELWLKHVMYPISEINKF